MREQRQLEATEFICNNEFTICYISPRFGKTKVVIDYLKEKQYNNILVVYPLISIKTSWLNEFEKWGFDKKKVKFTTTASLKNHIGKNYDVIVADEIQMFSLKQLQSLKFVLDKVSVKRCIGLTGTLTNKTEKEITEFTGLRVGFKYPLEQAIEEGIVTDYRITVVMTNLDSKIPYIQPMKEKPSFRITEAQRYAYLTEKIEQIKAEFGNLGFLPVLRQAVFKKSIGKRDLTKKLIEKYKNERLLIFCGVTDIADSLGVPVYHSKESDASIKDDFCTGKFNHLAVCKMLNAGVTVLPINKAIINAFDSNAETLGQQLNRLTNFEYDNPNKVAEIYIVCTNTQAELKWLNSALEFFEADKITYKKFEEL